MHYKEIPSHPEKVNSGLRHSAMDGMKLNFLRTKKMKKSLSKIIKHDSVSYHKKMIKK